MTDKDSKLQSSDISIAVNQMYGDLYQSENVRFGIVVSRYNESITQGLLKGCLEVLSSHQVKKVDVAWCHGAFELPLAADQMIRSDRYDAMIALGCIIRGQTYHFELISDTTVRGLQTVALNTGIPVALGVITTNNNEHAQQRSSPDLKNKGRDAGLAALEMAGLLRKLSQATPE